MKKAVSMLFAGLLIASSCGVVFAKDGKDKDKPRETRLEKLTSSLGLTPEQKGKVSVILEDTLAKIKETSAKSIDARKAIFDDESTKITPLLTPEQAKKYEAGRAERGKDILKESKELPEKRLEKLSTGLSLTPAQKEKVSFIMQDTDDKIKAEKTQSFKNVIQLIRDENNQIKALLNPEQLKKFKGLKKEKKAEKKENTDNKIKKLHEKMQGNVK